MQNESSQCTAIVFIPIYLLDLGKFTSWTHLLPRIYIAYVLRFISNCHHRADGRITTNFLQVSEWKAAKRVWIIAAQQDVFRSTIARLQDGKPPAPSDSVCFSTVYESGNPSSGRPSAACCTTL